MAVRGIPRPLHDGCAEHPSSPPCMMAVRGTPHPLHDRCAGHPPAPAWWSSGASPGPCMMAVRGIPHPLHDPAASACWRVGGLLGGASLSLNPQPFPQSLTQAATLQPQGRRAPALPLALQSSPTCLDCLTGVPVREGPSLSSVNDGSPDHAKGAGQAKAGGRRTRETQDSPVGSSSTRRAV